MHESYCAAALRHVAVEPERGDAALAIISPRDFACARDEITQWQGYQPTPLVPLWGLAKILGVVRIDYKDEGPRFGLGSFKALGGAYAALRVLQREIAKQTGGAVSLADIRAGRYASECGAITLVSATDGNHGRSLAWGCQRVGAPCRIYIHAEVSEGRAQAMRDLGADVIRIEGDYDASVVQAREEAEKNGWFVVSDTSWPGYTAPPRDVMAGYGVMVQEACDALTYAPTHVLVQGGVGGLAAAVAAALRQYWNESSPRIIVVEPEWAACLIESASRGKATSVPIAEETIMAGLSCGQPSEMAWAVLAQEARDFLTIPDSVVAPTVRLLAQQETGDPKVEAGESAVAGLAALIAVQKKPALWSALGLGETSRVLLFGSEGVTDPEVFREIMAGDRHG